MAPLVSLRTQSELLLQHYHDLGFEIGSRRRESRHVRKRDEFFDDLVLFVTACVGAEMIVRWVSIRRLLRPVIFIITTNGSTGPVYDDFTVRFVAKTIASKEFIVKHCSTDIINLRQIYDGPWRLPEVPPASSSSQSLPELTPLPPPPPPPLSLPPTPPPSPPRESLPSTTAAPEFKRPS